MSVVWNVMYIRVAWSFYSDRVSSVDQFISIMILSFETAVKINAAALCTRNFHYWRFSRSQKTGELWLHVLVWNSSVFLTHSANCCRNLSFLIIYLDIFIIYTYAVNQQIHTGKICFKQILLGTYVFRSLVPSPLSECCTRILTNQDMWPMNKSDLVNRHIKHFIQFVDSIDFEKLWTH